jgi:hypothetical protein
MTTYKIFLNTRPIATIEGTECAYSAYRKACEFAEIVGKTASLVWAETGEVIESSDDDDEYVNDDWDDDEPDADETGFDPYEGCYTWDC